MNYNANIFLKVLRSKRFFLSILIILLSMVFSLSAFIEEGMEYFFNHDYVMTFLQGYNGDRTLLTVLAPLVATIPFAAAHVDNSKSGTIKYTVSRMGYKKYFDSMFIINIFSSFITFLLGMITFLVIVGICFDKDINLDAYMSITNVSTYEYAAEKSPLLYISIIILHCSLVASMYSSVGLALSYFIKNKFVAWISPFILSTIASLFAMFIGLTKLEPMAIFDVSRVKGMNVLYVLIYIIVVISISYIISLNRFKKDVKNDEEI